MASLFDIFSTLSQDDLGAFRRIMFQREVSAGTALIQAGQVADQQYYILKGGCRAYVTNKAGESTEALFVEHEFASNYASYYSGKPSRGTLECFEDSTVFAIRKADLEQLYSRHPALATVGRATAEQAFLELDERTQMRALKTAASKYDWVQARYPGLATRISRDYLDSFLRIGASDGSRQPEIG